MCVCVWPAVTPGAETQATGDRTPVHLSSGGVCFCTGPRASVLNKCHAREQGVQAELVYAVFTKYCDILASRKTSSKMFSRV